MSVKEVTALRKAGRLKEAYEQALSELRQDQNGWTKSSMFWVLRDLCKQDIAQNDTVNVKERLSQMRSLLDDMYGDDVAERAYESLLKQATPYSAVLSSLSELSKSNAAEAYNKAVEKFGRKAEQLADNQHVDFAWIIYRYLKANHTQLSSVQVRTVLSDYMQLNVPKPSLVHSMILNFALNFAKENRDFAFFKFVKLWGVENLRADDFNENSKDGRAIPSLVSRMISVFVENQPVDWQELFQLLESNPNCLRHEELVEIRREQEYRHLGHLQKAEQWDELWKAFDAYVSEFAECGPSVWHSKILERAWWAMNNDNAWRFLPFAKKWNMENLCDEDWKEKVGKDDSKYEPLAIKAAKRCFEIVKSSRLQLDAKDIKWLLDLYGQVVEHTKNEWELRRYAMLHLWFGDNEEAIKIYKQVLTELTDRYYVWSELAACVQDNDDEKIGLLLKARSLVSNEGNIGKIHLDLAELWIRKGYKNEATEELRKYIKNCQKNGWNISDKYTQLVSALNSIENVAEIPDQSKYIELAEDFVFTDYEWREFVLTDTWKQNDKRFCRFFDGTDLSFIIKMKQFAVCQSAKRGDVLKFRIKIDEEKKTTSICSRKVAAVQKTITPLVAKKTDKPRWSLLSKVYGYVEYDNEQRHTLHIISQSSHLAFWEYKTNTLKKGDFVTYRESEREQNGTTKYNANDVRPCPKEEALPHFERRVFVVDNVNTQKQLFHIASGVGEIGGVIMFDETHLRPNVGDFLELAYCAKINKNGNRRIVPLAIQPTNETNEMRKSVTGCLEITEKEDKYYAFVDGCYVSAAVLEEFGFDEDCEVSAEAVCSTDGSWRIYHLERIE